MRTLSRALILGACLVVAAGPVDAKGTVQVQKVGQPMRTYRNVSITVAHKALKVTSADGKGTFIIDKAACSFNGEVQVCLPDGMKLQQGGTTSPIDISRGTVYVNLTTQKQPLPQSSAALPPNGILLSITTKIGTIVNLTGIIDEVSK